MQQPGTEKWCVNKQADITIKKNKQADILSKKINELTYFL